MGEIEPGIVEEGMKSKGLPQHFSGKLEAAQNELHFLPSVPAHEWGVA